MQSFFGKTFGGLTTSYYVRHFIFGSLIAALILWGAASSHNGLSDKLGLIVFVVVSTLLYPYSRFVYESVIGFVLGENVFLVNAILMLAVKATTMFMCWAFAIFVAPVGLAYLYWRNSRSVPQ